MLLMGVLWWLICVIRVFGNLNVIFCLILELWIVDTDVPSYSQLSPCSVLCSAESKKKWKYLQACHDRQADFTPLCASVDGMLGAEAEFFYGTLERPFSVIILRVTMLCVCGSCTKWRCLGIVNSVSLPLINDWHFD